MACLVHHKIRNDTYLYYSISFRNKDKGNRPESKRVLIGKINKDTGLPIFKPEAAKYVKELGLDSNVSEKCSFADDNRKNNFSVNDLLNSSVKKLGSHLLLSQISNDIGLENILQDVFPNDWQHILTLTNYLVCVDDPVMYCEDWLESNEALVPPKAMSSQRISEILASLSSQQITNFYSAWSKFRQEKEYLALDITSISSYSNLIESVEWGYNRDGEKLPQVNLCMLYGEESGLPVYSVSYSGSLKDVSTLKTTLEQLECLHEGLDYKLVMDKGFYSKKNIDGMLESKDLKFIIATPFTNMMAKKMVNDLRPDIHKFKDIKNSVAIGNDVLYGKTKKILWDTKNGQRIIAHILFNSKNAEIIRDDLIAQVHNLKNEASLEPEKCSRQRKYSRYLSFRKSAKSDNGYSIKIKTNIMEKELSYAGWLILLTNHLVDFSEAIEIYRSKDIVEKGFLRFKNNLGLNRLRVHSDRNMNSKLFIAFIALILMSHIHRTMLKNGFYKTMTMKQLIKTLDKLQVLTINKKRIIYPATKQQKTIFSAFGVRLEE
jgi:transposase